MRDNRVRQIAIVDELARVLKRRTIFLFKSDGATAVYIFGRRIYKSKHWNGGI